MDFLTIRGLDKVPASMLVPASHFRLIPRSGQQSTVIEIRSDSGLVGIGEAFGLPHSQLTASLIEGVTAPAPRACPFELADVVVGVVGLKPARQCLGIEGVCEHAFTGRQHAEDHLIGPIARTTEVNAPQAHLNILLKLRLGQTICLGRKNQTVLRRWAAAILRR